MAVLHTPRLDLPYPDGNDLLRDGDNRIHDLAAALDEIVATVDELADVELTPGPAGPAGADGAPGPQGPPGLSNAIYTSTWTWTTKTADANTAGQIGVNAATWAAATRVNVNQQKADNGDVTVYLQKIVIGDQLYLQHKTDATRYAYYNVTGAPVDNGTWWHFPVTFDHGAGAVPGGTTNTAFSIISDNPQPLTYQRATAAYTTASLATGAAENTGSITLGNGYRLYTVATNRPARVRLYTTTAKRSADAARAVGTDPTGDHGLILEYVTTASVLSADLSPTVDGFDGATTPTGAIPISITNLDASTGTVTATLTWVRTE